MSRIKKDRRSNPVAKTLSLRRFQRKVVKSGKAYRRIHKHEINTNEEN